MPLNFSISRGKRPAAQVVTPERVRKVSGNSMALAYTLPIISTDLTGVHFKQRTQGGVNEFAFDHGTMSITLRQEVYIANDLTPCAQRKWGAHELHHVNDNRDVMVQLEAEVMKYAFCKGLFQNGEWYPRSDFNVIQGYIQGEVGDAFRDLTAAKVKDLDTRAEYNRVAREILRDCPGPIIYTVYSGDSLSRIAEHYYGTQTRWRKIYDANRETIGKNPNRLKIGLRLVIPR